MKKIILTILLTIGLVGCSVQEPQPQTTQGVIAYELSRGYTPRVDGRAYSRATFIVELENTFSINDCRDWLEILELAPELLVILTLEQGFNTDAGIIISGFCGAWVG